MNGWIIGVLEVKTAHSAMAEKSNQLVVMNGTYLMKSRYKIPALVVLLKEVPEGVENGQNALNKRCRAYPL